MNGGLGKERVGVDVDTYDDTFKEIVQSFRVYAREVVGGINIRPALYCTIDILDDEAYPWVRLDTRTNDAGGTTSTRRWLDTYNDEMFAFLGILNPSDDPARLVRVLSDPADGIRRRIPQAAFVEPPGGAGSVDQQWC